MAALSEREMRVLAFERGWWRSPGAKEQEIRDALGMTATSYYQPLYDLIDRTAAPVRPHRPSGGARVRPGPGDPAAPAAGQAAPDEVDGPRPARRPVVVNP